MRRAYDSSKKIRIQEKMKKIRQCETENEENEDKLSDLPECVILHILSFLDSKHAVQTCVLSTRWKHLWARIPTLILHSSNFSTVKKFAIFVSNILTLRNSSTSLQALNLDRRGDIEPQLLKKILNYICSHNTHLHELGISLRGGSGFILNCVSSCHALTSLKLSLPPRGGHYYFTSEETLFPKSLNLPLLTNLDLANLVFCGGESGCADPFLAFPKLNSLGIRCCKIKDAQILNISSETLVNLAIHYPLEKMKLSYHDTSSKFAKIELSTPSLCTFTFIGSLIQKICGSGLSSVKQVNIDDSHQLYASAGNGLILLSWLLDFANVESFRVTSTTLQILSIVPDLSKVKLHSLCNLKSLVIEMIPFHDGSSSRSIVDALLKKDAAMSSKEVAKLRKTFKARLEPPAIPNGIVDFLRQNSPSAEVNIFTDYSDCFNLKQVVESIKGAKIISYRSKLATSAPSSAPPASAAEYAPPTAPASASMPASAAVPTSAAPPKLHFYCAEKDDKSSAEDKKEKHQSNTDSPLLDNGQ
ncbi:putative F-box domain, leucine-rich repeat domain, L domain-containing protein [Medicago truncatula]|uniref:F-box/RNI superfamily protein n=1 Tax=Medicago truncatula TaxID=3880 RepID=G7JSY9_MEDTR|nr:F-box/LRR-repeat protein At4g14103 isoform X1 [Medicago truncatula]AES90503.2 F-box/RNI superfamily protein [Medicago truncatula]RHN62593.1 putative F-box domain, leucine-rich repeat domain, L domain-containing protein [Medicago truncatula]